MIIKRESKYTKISIVILILLSVYILMNFVTILPIKMSRICWLTLVVISLILSILGKREIKTIISSVIMYINVILLGISLFVFKILFSIIRIVI